MAIDKDLTEDEVRNLFEEEKYGLKDDRVYLILEPDSREESTFAMFCVDRIIVKEGEPVNVCQVLARGLTELLSSRCDEVYELGQEKILSETGMDVKGLYTNVVPISKHRDFQVSSPASEDDKLEAIKNALADYLGEDDNA